MSFNLGSVILIALIISPISGVPQCSCPRQYAPVCGSDGNLYSNRCLLDCSKSLLRSDLTVAKEGSCEVPTPVSQECACVRNLSPVCGTDGITYNNICLLRCERQKNPSLEVRQQGTCKGFNRSKRSRSPYEKRYSRHTYFSCSSE